MNKIFKVTAIVIALGSGASVLAVGANAQTAGSGSMPSHETKSNMRGMHSMMCTMVDGHATMCVSPSRGKKMMMMKHVKMLPMMCKNHGGMGSEQYNCVTSSDYKMMMKKKM